MLASGSGLLKKMLVIYWEKWRSLSNWSESSRPKKEFGDEGGERGVGYDDEYACTYEGTWVFISVCILCWCA